MWLSVRIFLLVPIDPHLTCVDWCGEARVVVGSIDQSGVQWPPFTLLSVPTRQVCELRGVRQHGPDFPNQTQPQTENSPDLALVEVHTIDNRRLLKNTHHYHHLTFMQIQCGQKVDYQSRSGHLLLYSCSITDNLKTLPRATTTSTSNQIQTKRRKCGSYWPQTSLLSPLEVDWIKKLVLSALLKTRVSNNNRQEDDEIQILGFIIDFDEFLSSKIFSGKIKLSLKSLQITLSLTKCQKSKACKFQLSTALSTEHGKVGFVFPPEVGQVKLD